MGRVAEKAYKELLAGQPI